MTSATYNLPVPPGVNNLYPTNANGQRFKSQEYTVWQTQAAWELKQQKARPIPGKVEVFITVREPKRKTDIDGKIKAILDTLVKVGVIDEDHNEVVRKVSAAWGDVERARVEIRSAG